jgi:hypothetical protein
MNTEVTADPKVEEQKAPPVEGAPPVEKTEEQKKAEARNYSQEEVDRILAKVRKNERHRTKKEVEAYYKGLSEAGGRQEKKEAPKDEDREPVRADFDSYESFIEARATYRADKAARAAVDSREKEGRERQAAEARQKTEGEFQRKMREEFPNIEELVEEVGDMPIYAGVQQAIMESPVGTKIFNELLKTPSEFERLAALSEFAAIREIGKLEARFEAKAPKAEEKKEQKTASKAPAPVAPPGGASASGSDEPSDTDDTETWMRKERARLAKLRKQG